MDKVQAMNTFVTIVNAGSLTAAASALDKSLPTIVRTLASLEQSLGVRLLQRTTRRMTLTEEGRHYFERCQKILADIAEAERELSTEHQEPSGSLRVTASIMFGQMHVSPALVRFLERYSNMQVNLLLADRVVNLVEEGIDIAIRIGPLADSSMIAIAVGEVRRIVCASPALLTQQGSPVHPSALADSSAIRFTGLTPGLHWPFQIDGKTRNVPMHFVYTCNQAGAAIAACEAGLGYGRFLSYMVEPQLKAGTLRRVLEDFEDQAIPVHVVYPHARYVSTRNRVFIDWITADLRQRLGYH